MQHFTVNWLGSKTCDKTLSLSVNLCLPLLLTSSKVGLARCADRAAYQRHNVGRDSRDGLAIFLPPVRGQGRSSAAALPCRSRFLELGGHLVWSKSSNS
jgi:hypothetical protein